MLYAISARTYIDLWVSTRFWNPARKINTNLTVQEAAVNKSRDFAPSSRGGSRKRRAPLKNKILGTAMRYLRNRQYLFCPHRKKNNVVRQTRASNRNRIRRQWSAVGAEPWSLPVVTTSRTSVSYAYNAVAPYSNNNWQAYPQGDPKYTSLQLLRSKYDKLCLQPRQ